MPPEDEPSTPPEDALIETPELGDAEVIADLWVDLAADQRRYGSHLEDAPNRDRILETVRQHVSTGTAFVARRSGTIVGFVTFGTETGYYRQDVDRGMIHNIYVRNPHRGDGIGLALLQAAESVLESRGVDVIALQAMAANVEAVSFYERHGYAAHRIELEKPINGDPVNSDDA